MPNTKETKKATPGAAKKTAKKAPPVKKEAKADSKFAGFIATKKLDPRRILIASRKIEARQPEDRLIKLNKRLAKAAGDTPSDKPKETRKPRSGRPVTPRAMRSALEGGQLSGPTKTRLLNAVNHLLEQKKQEKVGLREIF